MKLLQVIKNGRIPLLLKVCFTVVLLSRAYQAWYFDLPLRALFWDQALWEPFIKVINSSWAEWLAYFCDKRMVYFQKAIALTWLVSAIVVWKGYHKYLYRLPLVLSFFFYLLLVLTDGKDHFYRIGQYFEFSLQLWVIAFFAFKGNMQKAFWHRSALAALLLTFAAHGFYALGIYPRPGHFVQMVVSCLGVHEAQAYYFLNVAGILDLILIPLVLLKGQWQLVALSYATFWGAMTSIARLWAHWDMIEWSSFLHQWLPQFGFRNAHFMVPLVLLLLFLRKEK